MTELTHTSFQDFVRANRFAVIHFYATWNGQDAKMKDLLARQIPAELSNVIAFGMLDVDPKEHHDICRQHKILTLPSLAFYRDVSLIQTVKGLRKSDEIIEHLRQLVS
jgi:thioredoxin-like negative regulator of GroEL